MVRFLSVAVALLGYVSISTLGVARDARGSYVGMSPRQSPDSATGIRPTASMSRDCTAGGMPSFPRGFATLASLDDPPDAIIMLLAAAEHAQVCTFRAATELLRLDVAYLH